MTICYVRLAINFPIKLAYFTMGQNKINAIAAGTTLISQQYGIWSAVVI